MSKINAKNLVHPYYRLNEAAAMLECTVSDLVHLAAHGRLEFITPYTKFPLPILAAVRLMRFDGNDDICEYVDFGASDECSDWIAFLRVPSDVCLKVELAEVGFFRDSVHCYIIKGFGSSVVNLCDARDGFLVCDVDVLSQALLFDYKRVSVVYSVSGDIEVRADNLYISRDELERLKTAEDTPFMRDNEVINVPEWKCEVWRMGEELKRSSPYLSRDAIVAQVERSLRLKGRRTHKGKIISFESVRPCLRGLIDIGVPFWEVQATKENKRIAITHREPEEYHRFKSSDDDWQAFLMAVENSKEISS